MGHHRHGIDDPVLRKARSLTHGDSVCTRSLSDSVLQPVCRWKVFSAR